MPARPKSYLQSLRRAALRGLDRVAAWLRGLEGERRPAELRWYFTANLTLWKSSALVAVSVLATSVLYLSPWQEALQTSLVRPLAFYGRHLLKKDPALDPRLKTYALDDRTLQYLQGEDVPLTDLALVLEAVDRRNPKAIFVDKVFGTLSGNQDAKDFTRRVKGLGTPVIVGAFVSDVEIAHRPRLPLDRAENEAANWSRDSEGGEVFDRLFPMQTRAKHAYGPHPAIRDAFSKIGHLVYGSDSYATLFYRLPSNRIIPLAPLLAGDQSEVSSTGLRVNGHDLFPDGQGRTLINLSHPSLYHAKRKVYPLADLIRFAKASESLDDISSGDTVLILMHLFTGSGQVVPTPWGPLSAGYLSMALVNSVLTGEWIAPPRFALFFIMTCGVLGALFGAYFKSLSFWFALTLADLLLTVLGIISFSYFRIEQPWLFEMLSFSAAGIACFLVKMRNAEEKTLRIKNALEGSFPADKMKVILGRDNQLWLRPSSRLVTIMFIDIVGFSVASEKEEPERVFAELKEILSDFTEVVHLHQGVIDKTLGDGMMACFGFDPAGGAMEANHALQALQAAILIQERTAKHNIEALGRDRFVFPVRIGINTSTVFVGDIGNHQRVDLTMIGHGVNMGKRLESISEPYCITLSESSFQKLPSEMERSRFRKRLVQIKHFTELVVTYEYDPFEKTPGIKKQAQDAYRRFSALERCHDRNPIERGKMNLKLGNLGLADLTDYSKTGFGITCPYYLGRGVKIECSLENGDPSFRVALEQLDSLKLLCEIRWSSPDETGRFRHGLTLLNTQDRQAEALFQLLHRTLTPIRSARAG